MLEKKYRFAIFGVIFLFIFIGLVLSNVWISRQLNDFPKNTNPANPKITLAAEKSNPHVLKTKSPALIDFQNDPFAPVQKEKSNVAEEKAVNAPAEPDKKIYEFSVNGPIFIQ